MGMDNTVYANINKINANVNSLADLRKLFDLLAKRVAKLELKEAERRTEREELKEELKELFDECPSAILLLGTPFIELETVLSYLREAKQRDNKTD